MAKKKDKNLDERVTNLEKQVAVVVTKVDALSEKVDSVVNEMRASRARQDEDMREIRTALNNNVRNMFFTLIIGVGAMVVAVLMK
ncbi:MAG: hypothetical protein IKO74_00935 [Selenomonadaceae bacterium]|nr:hypothetical protein [Selenomonadaceae bacterium]